MESPKDTKDVDSPRDPYRMVLIVFFFFGLGSMVPAQFFLTAFDFWMYKFRGDVSQEGFDLRNRTFLQKNFMSVSSITNSVPTILTGFISSYAAHKINIRKRFMVTLFASTATFFLFMIFIVVDTDNWQTEFFVLTMIFFGGLTIFGTLFGMSCLTLLSRFPPKYIKSYMYGTSVSGIISAILQILCLAIGGSSIRVGLFYFSTGTVIMVLTLILAYITKYLAFYNHFIGDMKEDTNRPLPSFADFKEVAKRIWPFLILMIIGFPTLHIGYPTITSLIVSEGYGNGNPWNDIYFVPVISFLLNDIASLVGRIFATPFLKPNIAVLYTVVISIKCYTLPSLFLFCNALPRHNLPVLFPHDWQYILILCLNASTDSYVAVVTMLSIKNFAREKTELAFMVIQSLGRAAYSASSPLGALAVNML